MGTRKIFTLDTHFNLMNGSSVNQFLYKNMVLFFSSCWFFFSNCLFYVIRFVTRYFFRYQMEKSSEKDDSNYNLLYKKDDEIVTPSNASKYFGSSPEVIDFKNSEYDGFEEKETPTFRFKFQFQSSEDIRRRIEESNEEKTTTVTNLRRYCFQSEKDLAGFIKESEIASFHVIEPYVDSEGSSFSRKEAADIEYEQGLVLDKDFQQGNECPEIFNESRKSEGESFSKDNVPAMEKFFKSEFTIPDRNDLLSEKDYCGFDSDPESITFSDRLSVKNQIADSNSNEFLLERDFCGFKQKALTTNFTKTEKLAGFGEEKEELIEGIQEISETQMKNSCVSDAESIDFSDGFTYVDNQVDFFKLYLSDTESMDFSDGSSVMNQFNEFLSESDFSEHKRDLEEINIDDGDSIIELLESEDTRLPSSSISEIESSETSQSADSTLSEKFLSEKDFGEDGCELETEQNDESQKSNTDHSQNPSSSDSDDMNGLESLWEHQDLIEQLRMELKKVRAIGLPTILEESESPRTIKDLKPWTIDENFLQEDAIDELHKFYKSYRERMRKFDILNYQKMYAIGFLQLEDPLQLMRCPKTPMMPTITSFLSQNLRRHERQKSDTDPSKKFIKELQSDLETIYVGQVCLSWEFLHWQYEKCRELSESDPQGSLEYNQVAGEFQQFQVLVQRFLENEPFQGPRVQNYVKSRCVLRNLLQVPAIKEDCKERRRGNDAITSEMLTEMMDKSIRIFWDFIKADRNETNVILKGFSGTQMELQDPTDLELLTNIRADLQKKEKKLKELLRTGNCLVKRFQKHQEEKSDQLIFLAQVDMKLVARVLKMTSVTTDQLLWCQKKLNKITFRDRKTLRQPSFLLFPC